MNVLSQDAARSFLSSSKADEKYKFFLNGTQLTQLANEYTTVSDVIKKIEVSLNQQGQALPELEEKKKEQVEKYKLAEKAREQMKKLEQINKLMVWSQVTDKENVSSRTPRAISTTLLRFLPFGMRLTSLETWWSSLWSLLSGIERAHQSQRESKG